MISASLSHNILTPHDNRFPAFDLADIKFGIVLAFGSVNRQNLVYRVQPGRYIVILDKLEPIFHPIRPGRVGSPDIIEGWIAISPENIAEIVRGQVAVCQAGPTSGFFGKEGQSIGMITFSQILSSLSATL
jgi:hypothetical protein